MLKLLNSNTETLTSFKNTKCAEVFCQNEEHFSIVCTICEMKIFDFAEFVLHFRNIHLNDETQIFDSTLSNKIEIKNERYEQDVFSEEKNSAIDEEYEVDMNISMMSEVDILQSKEEFIDNETPMDTDWQMMTTATDSDYELDKDEDNNDNATDGDEEYIPSVLKHKPKLQKNSTFNCQQCSKMYKLEKSLTKHMQEFHSEDGPRYKCSKCDSVFQRDRSLQAHLQKEHGGYPCPDCDKVYKSSDALRVHRYKHSGERQFICNIENCGKAFGNPKTLCSHKRLVHFAQPNLVCEICGHRTKVKSALELHKRMHTGEKPFICKICGKAFRSNSLLHEHQPIHSTERPHKCDVCGAAFSRPKALYHHKHLHLAVKKFVCKLCGKAYAQAAGLCGHMRQHKAEQF